MTPLVLKSRKSDFHTGILFWETLDISKGDWHIVPESSSGAKRCDFAHRMTAIDHNTIQA
jgi:hypothetical protein